MKVALIPPHSTRQGEVNILFFLYLLTVSEEHIQVCEAILSHLLRIENLMTVNHIMKYSSTIEYSEDTNMDGMEHGVQ